MSESERRLHPGAPKPLYKQNSWSPDILRDEAWTIRRRNNRLRRGRSVTDDDLDELRACFDLGFSFDSPDLDPKLLSTFPGLDFYCAVNRQYSSTLSRSSSASFSDCDSASSSVESPRSIIDPGKSSTHVFLGNWLNLTDKRFSSFSFSIFLMLNLKV